MAAYRVAVGVGVSPLEFWNMTPYLSRIAIGALHDDHITQLWMSASLTRSKKLPALDKLLHRRNSDKKDMVGLKTALMGAVFKQREA